MKVVDVTQPIRQTDHAAGKIANLLGLLRRASRASSFRPVRSFSFWAIIGPPTRAKRFRDWPLDCRRSHCRGGPAAASARSRGSYTNSGLRAGPHDSRARHPHSRDLYNEETRFHTARARCDGLPWLQGSALCANDGDAPLMFSFEIIETMLQRHGACAYSRLRCMRSRSPERKAPDHATRPRYARLIASGRREEIGASTYAIEACLTFASSGLGLPRYRVEIRRQSSHLKLVDSMQRF